MAICPKCGSYAPEGVRNCTVCNTAIPQSESHKAIADPRDTQEAPRERVYYQPAAQNDAPKVLWYIGMALLFAIPVIGLVMTIVIGAGGGNKAKRNFALANLILKIVGIILAVLLAVGIIAAVSEANFENGLPFEYWDEFFEGDWDEIPYDVWETFPYDSWDESFPYEDWDSFPYDEWDDFYGSGAENFPNM